MTHEIEFVKYPLLLDATKVCPLVFENRIAVCVVIAVIILSVLRFEFVYSNFQ